MLKLVTLMTRGIILEMRSRRWAMFILLLAAMLMLFAGSTFLAGTLDSPFRFLLYWGACAWLTLGAMLLAFWDLLVVRAAARAERRKLERGMIERPPDDEGEP